MYDQVAAETVNRWKDAAGAMLAALPDALIGNCMPPLALARLDEKSGAVSSSRCRQSWVPAL
jgi:hypothetical protein